MQSNGVDEAQSELDLARGQIDTLQLALESRTLIGTAVGLVMVEKGLTAEGAFAHLVQLSSHSNVKIRDIAATMVAEADRRAGGSS